MQAKKNWGFDTKTIDTSVRPQDDFYQYANGSWIKKTKIPADEARWGTFHIIHHNTQLQLKEILDGLLKQKRHAAGSPEQLVADMYRSATDMPRRNKLGIAPLAPERLLIRDITSVGQLVKTIAKLERTGTSLLWHTYIDQDSKNSSRNMLHLYQGGLGMPDRDYYLKDDAEFKRVREAYVLHIKKLLALAGFGKKECEYAAEVVMKTETKLAQLSMTKEDVRDPEKTYNKFSVAKLQKLTPQIDWTQFFKLLGAKVREVIVGQPKFFTGLGKLLTTVPLEEWKVYLEWHLINSAASALSEPFIKENFNFYTTVLTGTKKMRPLWRRGLNVVNGTVGEALGRIYIKRYFPPESKKLIDELVDDIFAAYENRIKNLDWMTTATKRKALSKLHAMGRKIGYPKKWQSYRGLTIQPDDYFGNLLRAAKHEHARQMRKLNRPVDRDEWFMLPQQVNAYNHLNLNEIVFLAAILQHPFFDPHNDAAVNYAGIGSVIGHEISHAFDNKGAKFDARGNMRNWWTHQDKQRFEKKGNILVKQFNQYTVAPGVNANGKLTLGENIADLGGMNIAFDAYQRHVAKTKRVTIGGFSPEERFFLGFAQAERDIAREEYIKTISLTDEHAHAPLRVNGPVSNTPAFYQTFNLKKGDKLYREPKDRARIW